MDLFSSIYKTHLFSLTIFDYQCVFSFRFGQQLQTVASSHEHMSASEHFQWTVFFISASYQGSSDCWLSYAFLLVWYGILIGWRHASAFLSAACSFCLLKESFVYQSYQSCCHALNPLVMCIFLIWERGYPLSLHHKNVYQSIIFARRM